MLSLSPPAQHCCVLLRAMAQDVHSWLLWQTQAPPKNSMATQKSAMATRASHSQPPSGRPQQRVPRNCGHCPISPAAGAAASTEKGSSRPPACFSHDGPSFEESGEHRDAGADHDSDKHGNGPSGSSGTYRHIRLFTRGESVWMVHAFLVLGIIACLLAIWYSSETPRSRSTAGA